LIKGCRASDDDDDDDDDTQLIGLLGQGISLSQDLYLHTEQQKHRINAHNTNIYAFRGIRTHDPSVRVSEDSS
jgi:hypothetical protein